MSCLKSLIQHTLQLAGIHTLSIMVTVKESRLWIARVGASWARNNFSWGDERIDRDPRRNSGKRHVSNLSTSISHGQERREREREAHVVMGNWSGPKQWGQWVRPCLPGDSLSLSLHLYLILLSLDFCNLHCNYYFRNCPAFLRKITKLGSNMWETEEVEGCKCNACSFIRRTTKLSTSKLAHTTDHDSETPFHFFLSFFLQCFWFPLCKQGLHGVDITSFLHPKWNEAFFSIMLTTLVTDFG